MRRGHRQHAMRVGMGAKPFRQVGDLATNSRIVRVARGEVQAGDRQHVLVQHAMREFLDQQEGGSLWMRTRYRPAPPSKPTGCPLGGDVTCRNVAGLDDSCDERMTFDHPPNNLFDDDTVPDLVRLLDLAEAEADLKVIVFDSANPDFFIAHFSPAAGYKNLTTKSADGHYAWTEITQRLSHLPAVSIAATRGRARGGGPEFALACDIRFGNRERAIFAQLEVGAGLLAIGGAIERLPRLMGRGRALEVLLGSDNFEADLAERYGWINRAIGAWHLDRVRSPGTFAAPVIVFRCLQSAGRLLLGWASFRGGASPCPTLSVLMHPRRPPASAS
jgi:enoyl-CoA hydratase/carnithine racemase